MILPKVKIGSDPMDKYSIPIGETKTKLSRIFHMLPRETPEKPGRSLLVVWDERQPLVKGFINNYSYTVTFFKKGNWAGNHYHLHKEELFYTVVGNLKVVLEDIKTKEREEIELKKSTHSVLYIPKNVAHTIIAKSDNSVLLVTATYPGTEEDEFKYKVL